MSQPNAQSPLREQLLIESDVQSALLLRAALYGGSMAVYFTVIQFFSQMMQHPEVAAGTLVFQFLDEAIYWGPGLMLLGPLFAYDMLKLSNRFAGPVFRLRREMVRLTAFESKVPLSFREDDYWQDLGIHFNGLRDEIHALRTENALLKAAATDASRAPADASNTEELDSQTNANANENAIAEPATA